MGDVDLLANMLFRFSLNISNEAVRQLLNRLISTPTFIFFAFSQVKSGLPILFSTIISEVYGLEAKPKLYLFTPESLAAP